MEPKTNLSPASGGVLLQGKRGKLLGHYYLPGGEYPKPVVLICHGIPGKERLFDFAIALREAGFCTLSFHYSGSWGSDGDYSVSHCFEDCLSALDYIRKNENGWFDLKNVFMVGHSMGGLMTARTAAQNDLVKAGVLLAPMDFKPVVEETQGLCEPKYRDFLDEAFLWLKGVTRETMRQDMADNAAAMDLCSYAEALADKPILTVAGTLDALLPLDEHAGKLNAAIAAYGKGKLTAKVYDTDHPFNMFRQGIRQDVVNFLRENVN